MKNNQLKKVSDLLEYGDGKFLIVENDEPAFVVMTIDEYKKLKKGQGTEAEILDKINDDIELWKHIHEDEEDEFDDEGFCEDDLMPDDNFSLEEDNYHDDSKDDDEIKIESLEDDGKDDFSPFNSDGIDGIPF